MSSAKKIALVTGGNKGIGYAIVRGLCQKLGDSGVVYLAARNEKLGQEAVKKLNEEKLSPEFVQLDLNDHKSIENARDTIVKKHGGLDILINNAAIAFKGDATEPFGEQAEVTVATNFTATLDACEILFPILRPHARVVNVSSSAGNVNYITNSAIRQRITSDDLTMEELKKTMADFVSAAKRDTHKDVGFPTTAYGMSKIGLTALSLLQQRQFDQDQSRPDIVLNAVRDLKDDWNITTVHPGYVDTDMSSHKGPKTIDEGAQSSIYAALLPPQSGKGDSDIPRGQFIWEDSTVRDFKKGW